MIETAFGMPPRGSAPGQSAGRLRPSTRRRPGQAGRGPPDHRFARSGQHRQSRDGPERAEGERVTEDRRGERAGPARPRATPSIRAAMRPRSESGRSISAPGWNAVPPAANWPRSRSMRTTSTAYSGIPPPVRQRPPASSGSPEPVRQGACPFRRGPAAPRARSAHRHGAAPLRRPLDELRTAADYQEQWVTA